MMRRIALRTIAPLATTLLAVAALAVPASASAAPASPALATAASASPARHSPGHHSSVAADYRNPMNLALPGGATAASCADPSVIRAHDVADKHWYLYCTSDALTSTEKDSSGNLVIHNVPTFQSTDLTHWTYVGDALPTRPSWVSADGGLWAPDVVFSGGHYLMYYAASATTIDGGGSAVGVATSDSPAGPWMDSGAPVVEPQAAGQWRFDPEVISAGGKSYVYYGSYFGGIFARQLSADGLSSLPATEKQIAIDNRYEGSYVVHHNGWYYFMASATNCCAGPLTGYSVFAARSRSPLGPFVDKDGVSILAGRVGGTPVLTQNGNRWVGTGHNTVITDYSGQDWIIYHAVDRTDPYYAGDVGYTKRPALIDPLDWKSGWPVVRGGSGPSDRVLPGPAAQPGERTAYRPRFVHDPRVGAPYASLSDSFTGSALSSKWTWIRQPDASEFSVSDGSLKWQTEAADLHPESVGSALASVLTEKAPRGDYVVEAKVNVSVPAEGCCQNYVQGGLVIYGDDGNYVKLASSSIWNTRQTEFGNEVTPVPTGYPNYGNGVAGPVAEKTWLRIVRQGDLFTAYTSIDGHSWDRGGTWTHSLGSRARIGLISMGGAGFTTTFDYVKVSALRG
jgi:arabinan endo-1,5-alpha-L-arabinosidase